MTDDPRRSLTLADVGPHNTGLSVPVEVLKPCPFCGNTGTKTYPIHVIGSPNQKSVSCTQCATSGPWGWGENPERSAVAAWNRRP